MADISNKYAENYTFSSINAGKSPLSEEYIQSWFSVSWGRSCEYYPLPVGIACRIYPETLSDGAQPTWNTISILNRVGNLFSYSGTTSRKTSFSFTLTRDMWRVKDNFDKVVNTLRSTCYPKYSAEIMYPPLVTFVFGDAKFRGIVNNCEFTWKKPIIDNKYSVCEVSITMTDLEPEVITATYFQNTSALNPFGR